MNPFTPFHAQAASLRDANIDTDIIFPARFLLHTQKRGLGRYAFYEWRYGPDDHERPEFILNQGRFKTVEILIAGDNFGCGSSREQAPWALKDLGVRCVISTSFGEIFYANCFKNGILPIVIAPAELQDLFAEAEATRLIGIDLEAQTIEQASGRRISFQVESWRREGLLKGWDEIAMVVGLLADAINAFEHHQRAQKPWLFTQE